MIGTRGQQGSKNNVDDFERQGFIERVEGTRRVSWAWQATFWRL